MYSFSFYFNRTLWYNKTNKHLITCNSTNLTYMIECKKCKKQSIRETKRTLRERFSENSQATNNSLHTNVAAAVPSHFNLPGHSITGMGASRRDQYKVNLLLTGLRLQPKKMNGRRQQDLS